MNVLVISRYPTTDKSKKAGSLALYAQNTLQSIIKTKKNSSITVLAEMIPGTKNHYSQNGITVNRTWKKGSPTALFSLFSEIIGKKYEADVILIEFSITAFGSSLSIILFPLFLLALKATNKKVVVAFHQVLATSNDVQGYTNISNKIILYIITLLLHEYYSYIISNSEKVIVLDEILKKKLKVTKQQHKIVVIPRAVESIKALAQKDARKKLKLPQDAFILGVFGYFAWYKGTDWLVESYKQALRDRKRGAKKLMLIIAGGPNSNNLKNPFYKSYIKKLEEEARDNDVEITRFIPDEKRSLYFSACDLLVFPYRSFFSASKSLSLAYSFNKPFIISKQLEGIFRTDDLSKIARREKLNKNSLVFDLKGNLTDLLSDLEKSPRLLQKIRQTSKAVAKTRSWYAIGRAYYEALAE